MIEKKEAIFMLGLPGSGKSTYINNNDLLNYYLVSADKIRESHPNYNPLKPDLIHEECIKLAEEKVYELAESNGNIIMDGGGINNSYTLRIINNLKERGYYIKVIFINTPVQICIDRNNKRLENNERFVPTKDIIEKSYKLMKSVFNLSAIADSFKQIDYFTNKYIFVDMDGVVAEYHNLIEDENGNIDFSTNEIFKYSKPVYDIINRIKNYYKDNYENVFIFSASPNSICNAEKIEWLKLHMPFIKNENIFFVGNKQYKTVMLENLISKLKLDRKDILLLDDEHFILENSKKLNINVMHPSKFMTQFKN